MPVQYCLYAFVLFIMNFFITMAFYIHVDKKICNLREYIDKMSYTQNESMHRDIKFYSRLYAEKEDRKN